MKNESTIRILRAALLSAGAAFAFLAVPATAQSITATFTTVAPTENVTHENPATLEPGYKYGAYYDGSVAPNTYNWHNYNSTSDHAEVGATFTTTEARILDKFTVQITRTYRDDNGANWLDDARVIKGVGGQQVEVSLLTFTTAYNTQGTVPPEITSTVSLGTATLPVWTSGDVPNLSFLTFDLPGTTLAANTSYGILLSFVTAAADNWTALYLVVTPGNIPGVALYKNNEVWNKSSNALVSYIQTTAIPPAVPEPATTAALLGAALGGAALGLRHFAARR